MDMVFKGTPWGDITIKESWPEWQQSMWLGFLKDFTPVNTFVPAFEDQHYVTGQGGTVALNRDYFATEETAMEMARRFGAQRVVSVKYQGSGGSEVSDARERWLVFFDGIALNAGLLAAQFSRNPVDTAERNCWRGIAEARAGGQKLPAE